MDPMAMLFWAAVINGVVAVPIMAVMMILISRQARTVALPVWLKSLGWLATALMALTVALMLWSAV
jgi:Mn2+/Fe2+ NRAMP family transporter